MPSSPCPRAHVHISRGPVPKAPMRGGFAAAEYYDALHNISQYTRQELDIPL